MEPVRGLAVMECGDAGLRVTLTAVLPTVTLVFMAYGTLPGSRSVTDPTSVVAVMAGGTAEKVTSILPADKRRVACTDDTSWPRIDPARPVTSIGPDTEPRSISPAFVCAVTCPERDSSWIVPTLYVEVVGDLAVDLVQERDEVR